PHRLLLLARLARPLLAVELGEGALELRGRLRLEVVLTELTVDGAQIIFGARPGQLDLELLRVRLVAGDFAVHRVEGELAHSALALLHRAGGAELAKDEELGEGTSLARPPHDLAGGTLRPVGRRGVGRHVALELLALVPRAVRL